MGSSKTSSIGAAVISGSSTMRSPAVGGAAAGVGAAVAAGGAVVGDAICIAMEARWAITCVARSTLCSTALVALVWMFAISIMR